MTSPQALYRFFNADGDLLYVGISLNPFTRWKQHRSEKPWWVEVVNVTIQHYDDRETVSLAELDATKNERPRYNRTHNPDTLEGAERMASLLGRMVKPPKAYQGTCPDCGALNLPTQLYPEKEGWFAIYDCTECGREKVWTREFVA